MDIAAITAGMAAAKTGFDTLRMAVGLVKDVQGVLPAGEKKEIVQRTLEEAEIQMRTAEAQIAKALGFPLCTCIFPPPVMLKVGHRRKLIPGPGFQELSVHECPRCLQTDAYGSSFQRKLAAPGSPPIANDTA